MLKKSSFWLYNCFSPTSPSPSSLIQFFSFRSTENDLLMHLSIVCFFYFFVFFLLSFNCRSILLNVERRQSFCLFI